MQTKKSVTELSDFDLGEILWSYNSLEMPLKIADIIIVLGSNDIRVADHGAYLFHKKISPLIVVSGGIAHNDDLLATGWDKPEAEIFLQRLLDLDVPEDNILIEREAKNTGQNITNTRNILEKNDIDIYSGLLVQKPFMQRRAIATAEKQWPEIEWRVTSPNITYEMFIQDFGKKNVLNILTGDTWRIIEYDKMGFQTEQAMSNLVKNTLSEMISRGYTQHLPENLSADI